MNIMDRATLLHKLLPLVYGIPFLRTFYLKRKYISLKDKPIWGGGLMEQEITTKLLSCLSSEEKKNRSLVDSITLDMLECYLRYGATPEEYFGFGLRFLSGKRRASFLTNQYKDRRMISLVGFQENWNLLEDKSVFYSKFKQFFNRDVCVVKSENDFHSFEAFCLRHDSYIAKPLNGQCGKGIAVIDVIKKYPPRLREDFCSLLQNHGEWILEELIQQDARMAAWNTSSVNTVRLPCFMNKTGFHVFKPFLRTGRQGSIVDNGNSGGIFAIIDEETGVIKTQGQDIKGNKYDVHPDSGIPFLGTQLPQWDELIAFAQKVHATVAWYPYIGWDFALTPQGWVLIEGNWGQFLSEFVDHEGIKDKFDSLLNC